MGAGRKLSHGPVGAGIMASNHKESQASILCAVVTFAVKLDLKFLCLFPFGRAHAPFFVKFSRCPVLVACPQPPVARPPFVFHLQLVFSSHLFRTSLNLLCCYYLRFFFFFFLPRQLFLDRRRSLAACGHFRGGTTVWAADCQVACARDQLRTPSDSVWR